MMKDRSLIFPAVRSQDERRGPGAHNDSAADDAFDFCVAQGFLRKPQTVRSYSAKEIYRLKLVRVIMGGLKVTQELNALRARLPAEEQEASRAAPALSRPESSLAMIRDLVHDFPERV